MVLRRWTRKRYWLGLLQINSRRPCACSLHSRCLWSSSCWTRLYSTLPMPVTPHSAIKDTVVEVWKAVICRKNNVLRTGHVSLFDEASRDSWAASVEPVVVPRIRADLLQRSGVRIGFPRHEWRMNSTPSTHGMSWTKAAEMYYLDASSKRAS